MPWKKISLLLLFCLLATHVTTKAVHKKLEDSKETRLDSSEHSVERRALPVIIAGAVAVAPIFSAIFGLGSFTYGIINGQMRLGELKEINSKLDGLQESVDDLAERVQSLELGHEWLEGVNLYGNDVQRLRFLLHSMRTDVNFCNASGIFVLKSEIAADLWADAVLDNGPSGLRQVLFSMHDLVMGTEQLFGRRSLVAIYKDQLGDTSSGLYPQQIEDFIRYIMALQTGGYAAISIAMNIKEDNTERVESFIKDTATMRMEAQWIRISEIVGVVSSSRLVPSYTPPFHIAADGYGDLGVRFVELNGDGKIDMVYHRWINGNNQQKGAYLNNGNGWTLAPQYIPPYHIAADNHGDLGARFVDLNGDGKMDMLWSRWIDSDNQQKGAYLNNGDGWTQADQYIMPYNIASNDHSDLGARFIDLNGDGKVDMVYHRWINSGSQQKGAFINNGNGWTWAPEYAPPYNIAADNHGDLGARFVDLNGDGKMDMVYHRWINGNSQQKGAHLNNGNGWTWAEQYIPPYHIAADNHGDLGARFVDLNGDGKMDMLWSRWIDSDNQQKGAYLNNGDGWTQADQYIMPYNIASNDHSDLGARFIDLNGDGKMDMAYNRWINGNRQQKGAFINNGNGWTWAPQYAPPFHLSADGHGDLGARYVDLDGDKNMDLIYHRWISGDLQQKGAYITREFFGEHTKNTSEIPQVEPGACY